MPAISAAVLLQYAAACHTPVAVPEWRIKAEVQVESAHQITSIHDNNSGRSYAPASVGDAVALARLLLSQGHRIDAGAMQVTDRNWQWLGLTVETVFDTQRNVCAGMTVLADAYRIERAVSCRYNTGKPDCANGYPERIEAARFRVAQADDVPAAQVSAAAPPPPVDPTEPDAWDLWRHDDWQRRKAEQAASPPAAPPVTITEVSGEDQP